MSIAITTQQDAFTTTSTLSLSLVRTGGAGAINEPNISTNSERY